ncbi:MAG: hypothetical protein FGF51_04525 [Candidatus Brockarchaeota archaeon]|nr:hypothetical protein [Candidatus Brockarchaeota archaeon]
MQGEDELTEEELYKVASKYIGARKELFMRFESVLKEAKAALSEIPEKGKIVLYTNDLENVKKLASASGVDVVSEYPLINGIVVFGEKKKVFRLVLNDLVKEFDVIRKVKLN